MSERGKRLAETVSLVSLAVIFLATAALTVLGVVAVAKAVF